MRPAVKGTQASRCEEARQPAPTTLRTTRPHADDPRGGLPLRPPRRQRERGTGYRVHADDPPPSASSPERERPPRRIGRRTRGAAGVGDGMEALVEVWWLASGVGTVQGTGRGGRCGSPRALPRSLRRSPRCACAPRDAPPRRLGWRLRVRCPAPAGRRSHP